MKRIIFEPVIGPDGKQVVRKAEFGEWCYVERNESFGRWTMFGRPSPEPYPIFTRQEEEMGEAEPKSLTRAEVEGIVLNYLKGGLLNSLTSPDRMTTEKVEAIASEVAREVINRVVARITARMGVGIFEIHTILAELHAEALKGGVK
jgi:hypothetical protein